MDSGQAPAAGDVIEQPVLLLRGEVRLPPNVAVRPLDGAREPGAEDADVELAQRRRGENVLVPFQLRFEVAGRI